MLEWATLGARFAVIAGSLVLYGACAFFALGFARPDLPKQAQSHEWRRTVIWLAAGTALAGSALWLMSEAVSLGGTADGPLIGSTLWAMISETHFGQVGACRCAVLAMLLIAHAGLRRETRQRWLAYTLVSALIVGSLAWTGHGSADSGMRGLIHQVSDLLHLLTAGLWVGALVPLCVLSLRAAKNHSVESQHDLSFGLNQFSRIGIGVVAILLVSGILNSWFLIGPSMWRSILSTPYGRLLLIKVVLFAAMAVLALLNRVRLAPAIGLAVRDGEVDPEAQKALGKTLITETGLAIVVLALVAMLGMLEPPGAPG